jgi:hypothetical protein
VVGGREEEFSCFLVGSLLVGDYLELKRQEDKQTKGIIIVNNPTLTIKVQRGL